MFEEQEIDTEYNSYHHNNADYIYPEGIFFHNFISKPSVNTSTKIIKIRFQSTTVTRSCALWASSLLISFKP
jgi:hypothetical protein